MAHRPKSPPYYMGTPSGSKDEEDEDAYHPHVVLTPSLHPYNKEEKIREANMKLKKEPNYVNPHKQSKVHFKEVVTYDDDVLEEDEEDEFQRKDRRELSRSKPCSKILLVTVPTGFYNESEEVITDEDDCENDIDLVNDAFRRKCGTREAQKGLSYVNSEEDLDETTPPLTEDTFSSSIETVLCRSETEDSDLTEVFSKSVSINPKLEDVCISRTESVESLESYDFMTLFKEETNQNESLGTKNEDRVIICPKETTTRNHRPCTAISVTVHRKSPLSSINSQDESKIRATKYHDNNRAPDVRPSTAPAKRVCCNMGSKTKLPSYNGLRSEYGMSAEQLREREKRKSEIAMTLKLEKEKKYIEQKVKRKENETTFNNWLIKKKREAEARALRRRRQSNFCFRTLPAPTAHLDRIGILRRKMLKRENTCFLLNEIFRNANPHEQKTFRIYLGLGSE